MKFKEILKDFDDEAPEIIIALNHDETTEMHARIYGRGCREEGHELITNFALDWISEQVSKQLPF